MGTVDAVRVRYRLTYDSALVTHVFQMFCWAVFAFLKRRARGEILKGQCGAVTFLQGFR
jgi:hypothetical protein